MSLANYKLSLYHELKTVMLPDFGYIEEISGEELLLINQSANLYQFDNKEIAYADASGRINPSGVTIYDASRELALSEFTVDYVNSYVTLAATPSGLITSDYSHYTVTVIDAFPDTEEFEAMQIPLISIDLDGQQPDDYAIGQNASYWKMSYFIDIFGISDVMRMQLMDRIQRSLLKWIPLVDIESNMPLNFDGSINEDFDWDAQFIHWMKLRGKPRGTLLNLGDASLKEKYRAVINGVLTDIH